MDDEPIVIGDEYADAYARSSLARNGNQPDPDRGSWTPLDLTSLPDQPPVQPTLGGTGLIYPGKRHVFSGPPESAKTLAAYTILIMVARTGGTSILIDFEMGPYDARQRLYELGATTDEVRAVRYLEPSENATEERIDTLVRLHPSLVVVDAAAGAYALEGLDDNRRQDVEKISRLYVALFWRAGIATIFIDHVVKDTENRGRFAIGSERKLGGADVHFGFDTITPISRGTTGRYKILTHKDRAGYMKRGHVADMVLESDPETHQIAWKVVEAQTTSEDGRFRPTHLMEKLSRLLEQQPVPITRNAAFEAVRGNRNAVFAAIDALVLEEFVTQEEGSNRSKMLSSVRVYREDDPSCNPETDAGGISGIELFSGGTEYHSGVVVSVVSPLYREIPPIPPDGSTEKQPVVPAREGRWLEDLTAPFDADYADTINTSEGEQ